MLAVANVILNRLENGYWGSTLHEVIYSPGQFAGSKKEYVEPAQKRGIPKLCYTAAQDALAGKNNIGDFMFFCADYHFYDRLSTDAYPKFLVTYILKEHIFYKRNW